MTAGKAFGRCCPTRGKTQTAPEATRCSAPARAGWAYLSDLNTLLSCRPKLSLRSQIEPLKVGHATLGINAGLWAFLE
jgi:hypothetical protein